MTRRVLQITDLDTGVIVRELHRADGCRHREASEGPAASWRDAATGVTILEYWCRHGRLHREGGPAVVKRDAQTGKIQEHRYYSQGLKHRDPKEGPALIRFYIPEDPRLTRLYQGEWYRGPIDVYYVHGRLHRDLRDGPARIWRDYATGQVNGVDYWVDHQYVDERGRRGTTYYRNLLPPKP